MDIIQIVGLSLVATFLVLVVKEQKPLFAFSLTLFVSIIIFIFLIDEITQIFELLERIAREANIETAFFITILKIIGIAYITEFAAQIAKDAGQASIAGKIELSGKILILVIAVPILSALIDVVLSMFPA